MSSLVFVSYIMIIIMLKLNKALLKITITQWPLETFILRFWLIYCTFKIRTFCDRQQGVKLHKWQLVSGNELQTASLCRFKSQCYVFVLHGIDTRLEFCNISGENPSEYHSIKKSQISTLESNICCLIPFFGGSIELQTMIFKILKIQGGMQRNKRGYK